ncbi:MAG: DNA adenine methylase [Candidatus Gastranaerophilales bacterium]|nr:DNA adenine methylase [Candidatus Gastranaerophilales bacterium]
MRYLGNKTKLLGFIESVINKYQIEGEVFADLFAGTASVGDYFKGRYRILANDYMNFSGVLCRAKLKNVKRPRFTKFKKLYHTDPFSWLNDRQYEPQENFFIYQNYTPRAGRMYLTEENAVKIDGMRAEIENLYREQVLKEEEYAFLLASLLESVPKVSNTSGTYQAYFKFWEQRSLKPFVLEPLEMFETDRPAKLMKNNRIYTEDANALVRRISGDIAYIDPPYTATQYTNSYHLLETIALNDEPEIFGKTGRRVQRELSGYSNRQQAIVEFEDLFRQLDFEHVLVSYSNQSIVPIEDMVKLARLFAVDHKVYIETSDYREYATNNLSYKGEQEHLKETVIYFRKDRRINKSPLNYSGSKDGVLPLLYKCLPKHVGFFVDAMGGAFNVGANVCATEQVVYNEYNPYVYKIVDMLVNTPAQELIDQVDELVERFGLRKKGKEAYLKLREAYNENKSPLYLFTLQIYAFQNMIRFNSGQRMNTPVGNNEWNEGTRERILKFKVRTQKREPLLLCGRYEELLETLADEEISLEETIFYFDPPYFITNAEYNDGKRGLDGWDQKKEEELLNFLLELHEQGYLFMLSNVLEHNGREHVRLKKWIEANHFHVREIGRTGIKYPRTEVVVTNYEQIGQEGDS